MREILFRGKDVKEYWHSGFLCKKGYGWYISNSAGISTAFEVIPSTIGQYTGITDKNDRMIFEGDIIIYGFKPCVVKWDNINACFFLYENGKTQISGFNADTMKLLEIIGNIHDNPELLKEAEQE